MHNMPRPCKQKILSQLPLCTYFKPAGVKMTLIEQVTLTHEEIESIKLCDLMGLSQEDAGEKMGIHQSTLQRILARSRQKVSDALINSKAIQIQGGFNMPNMDGTGPQGKGARTGRGLGNCPAQNNPNSNQAGFGRGMGRGRGFGRGRGLGLGRQ
jgi:predicted DNA-binding protein (UPF0251 family)